MSIPYLPLFVADYEADTAHLTVAEDGAYMRLLRLQWRTPGCTLPDDHAWIQRRVRASDSEWQNVYLVVIEEFFSVEKARLFSRRLLSEYERVLATSQKRSDAGKKGGRPAKPLKPNETGKRRAKAKRKHLDPDLEPEEDIPPKAPQGGRREECITLLSQVVSEETAAAFFEHREKMPKRSRLTEYAAKLTANRLADWQAAGHDPTKIVETAMMNGWIGVQEPRHPPKPPGGLNGKLANALRDAKRSDERAQADRGMADGQGGAVVVDLLRSDRQRDLSVDAGGVAGQLEGHSPGSDFDGLRYAAEKP